MLVHSGLAANASWFDFRILSGEYAKSPFGVYAFSGEEAVCKPYEFSIELVSRRADIDLTGLLGVSACLSLADRSGTKRLVHGRIREMEQLHTGNSFTHYSRVIVPRLWFLRQIRDYQIFRTCRRWTLSRKSSRSRATFPRPLPSSSATNMRSGSIASSTANPTCISSPGSAKRKTSISISSTPRKRTAFVSRTVKA